MDSAAQVLERLKALARLVLAASVGLALLLAPPRATPLFPLLGFIFAVYFIYAALGLFFHRELTSKRLQAAALVGDIAALGVVLLVAPAHSTAFLLFFLYFALLAGLWRGWLAAAVFSLLVSMTYMWLAWKESLAGPEVRFLVTLSGENWAVIGGLLAAGSLVGTLAQRERRHVERAAEVERFARLLSLDARWPELWKGWLKELGARFRARRTLLAYHDPETDRVTLWQFGPGDGGTLQESDRPPRDARTFLLIATPLSLLGNSLDRAGAEEWQLRHELSAAATLKKKFSLPERFREEFSLRSLLSAPLMMGGGGQARLFLLDAEGGGFTLAQLDDLQWLLAGLVPMLANVLTVRSLILRAVNQERDEISRALHDGVAQTLASLEMQLNVYQRLAAEDPARTAEELGRLQSVVKQEQEALRRFVRTLKPVRVP
ncbi:MAG TPA: histidine kinase dimerization/phosphoacceptor domain-containing protein, partial [Candidatus Acidoferrales bacterium]|nr:histidine kinase dimerization/phosphoacceptor domain-containing protein [Candidatus Acidoferrales bacterium]